MVIEVRDLIFSYDRRRVCLQDISFSVREGEILGFLGPSGAGKSTLQKILCGILRDYQGSVEVLGTQMKQRSDAFFNQIGVDFEFPNLYAKFTGMENLTYFASLYATPSRDPLPYLERIGLAGDRHQKVAHYSKGMKMRLAFIRALLHDPRLLFLDEPTSGLDPSYSRVMKDMILEQRVEGKTIILTTHNMHDADELCDRVAFIVDGRIVALDTPRALRGNSRDVAVKYVYRSEAGDREQSTKLTDLSVDPVFRAQLEAGTLQHIRTVDPSLEDVFIQLTGRDLI